MESKPAKLFRNRRTLLENATSMQARRARDVLLDLLEASIDSVQPDRLVAGAVQLEGEELRIGDQRLILSQYEHIWVLGVGKCSVAMARAVEQILGGRISGGCVASPYEAHLRQIEVVVSGYPIPDVHSIEAAEKILTIARIAGPADLVISLISGGGSSLAELPLPGLKLSRLETLTKQLLASGADTKSINAVRQALSLFKGGGVASAVFPATHFSLVISDVVGDSLQTIASAPTVPMNKPIALAATVLGALPHNDDLLELLELHEGRQDRRILAHELDVLSKRQHNLLVGNNDLALQTICTAAKASGLQIAYLQNKVEGKAREVARDFVSEVRKRRQARPQLFLMGGQTTISMPETLLAGRNHELALSAVRDLSEFPAGTAMGCMATDGLDVDDMAGSMVDSATHARARKLDMEPERFLARNNASAYFSALRDQLRCGATGANVCDLTLLVSLI